jgi:hypothetical protein
MPSVSRASSRTAEARPAGPTGLGEGADPARVKLLRVPLTNGNLQAMRCRAETSSLQKFGRTG